MKNVFERAQERTAKVHTEFRHWSDVLTILILNSYIKVVLKITTGQRTTMPAFFGIALAEHPWTRAEEDELATFHVTAVRPNPFRFPLQTPRRWEAGVVGGLMSEEQK